MTLTWLTIFFNVLTLVVLIVNVVLRSRADRYQIKINKNQCEINSLQLGMNVKTTVAMTEMAQEVAMLQNKVAELERPGLLQ